jgi:hypothetical protein
VLVLEKETTGERKTNPLPTKSGFGFWGWGLQFGSEGYGSGVWVWGDLGQDLVVTSRRIPPTSIFGLFGFKGLELAFGFRV